MKRNLIDIKDFSVEELYRLIDLAKDIKANGAAYAEACRGRKLATLFYEPSTRTRLSFEAAMMELGGNVLGFSAAASSSASKGESVADTAKVISCFADIIAMRHPYEGAPYVAAANASIPVINAGDGSHNHPTQTLTDLLTISCEKGRLDHMVVGCCGDLKYGRTVHSLTDAMSRYPGIEFVFISPEELRIPNNVRTGLLEANGIPYTETESLEEALPRLDVLYMTRIQRERFADEDEYLRLKDSYVLNTAKLRSAGPDMCILHPLPRVNEITVAVDSDPRACYFKQVLNGKYIRMALILTLLGLAEDKPVDDAAEERGMYDRAVRLAAERHLCCGGRRCITRIEQELPQAFRLTDKGYRCIYCDRSASPDTGSTAGTL